MNVPSASDAAVVTARRVRPAVLVLVGVLSAATSTASPPLTTQDGVDLAMVAAIKDEALNRSEVMEHLGWLADVYGPRVTGSPAIEEAAEWAMGRFRDWGLEEIGLERFAFGKGWSVVRFSAHLLEPQIQPLIGYPRSWSPGTGGPVEADVVRVQIDSEEDFETYRGQLAGKIVLSQPARPVAMLDGDLVLRMDERLKGEARTMPVPTPRASGGGGGGDARSAFRLRQQIREFYRDEGVIAVLDRGSGSDSAGGGSGLSWRTQRVDGGTIFVGNGGPRDENAGNVAPSATLAVEHYNRLVRLLDRGVPVKLEIDIRTRFHEEIDGNGFNLLAEIPGTDLADEVVMIGAHFDSTHAATGATDNASGTAAMMEAMRVLQAVGVRPRRTIRIGLWGGEEQGLLGSREYVRRHFGDATSGEMTPEYDDFSTYFNIDNGTGRIHGVWLQGNLAAAPVLERWVGLVRDLGVDTLGPRSVGGTDHASFDRVGLPGFQFVQDRLEYNSRTHHSNMDVYDRVQGEDMVQMATVVAVFAYSAAMADEKMPRKLWEPGRSR